MKLTFLCEISEICGQEASGKEDCHRRFADVGQANLFTV